MPNQYIYTFKYDYHNIELAKLESRQMFNEEMNEKCLFSTIKIDPSISPFIKNRFEILSCSDDYEQLLEIIKNTNIKCEGFKVEYMVLEGDSIGYRESLGKLKDVGYRIEGFPDYYNPTRIYSICKYENTWYFGILVKHDKGWYKHKQKPYSFSSSINMDIAKTLVGIASKGNKETKLLDACCGVGTIMLEACFAGFDIEGCEISWKICNNSRGNLAFYDYAAIVHHTDIKDHAKQYDAAIIDLPYNIYSYSDDQITENIIESTAQLTDRVVIVSTADIAETIKKAGLKVHDYCSVDKRGKVTFSRNIWVCEKEKESSNNLPLT